MNNKIAKIRLDQLLVLKGLVENASKARARIMAGDVIVNDHVADKAGEKFAESVAIRLRGNSHPYVSRGGVKLEHAIKTWPFLLTDAVAIDVGASTGGFSQVLLQHGVQRVFAVDVGYGQLAESLRQDSRIVNLERTHILHVDKTMFSPVPNIAVIDVSFISLKKILVHVKNLLSENAMIYALVKPQFEAGREHIAKGGIVKDPAIHAWVLDDIKHFAKDSGLTVLGAVPSPILGAKGNVEFLIACQVNDAIH